MYDTQEREAHRASSSRASSVVFSGKRPFMRDTDAAMCSRDTPRNGDRLLRSPLMSAEAMFPWQTPISECTSVPVSVLSPSRVIPTWIKCTCHR